METLTIPFTTEFCQKKYSGLRMQISEIPRITKVRRFQLGLERVALRCLIVCRTFFIFMILFCLWK